MGILLVHSVYLTWDLSTSSSNSPALMGLYNHIGVNEKKSIEIWLGHLKVREGSSTFITPFMHHAPQFN